MKKKNCWEYKMCGREPNGSRASELGVCPVTQTIKLNSVHDGWNAGRACWVVAGSMCGGTVQGTFAQKFKNCQLCDFYRLVKSEESGNFRLSATLLSMMN
ncbi:MAG: hypothetical protein OHK006_15180 [Thermodesulfovibrionales bacterium]